MFLEIIQLSCFFLFFTGHLRHRDGVICKVHRLCYFFRGFSILYKQILFIRKALCVGLTFLLFLYWYWFIVETGVIISILLSCYVQDDLRPYFLKLLFILILIIFVLRCFFSFFRRIVGISDGRFLVFFKGVIKLFISFRGALIFNFVNDFIKFFNISIIFLHLFFNICLLWFLSFCLELLLAINWSKLVHLPWHI